MNKTIFITGGAGYVGSALVPILLQAGHRVVVYDPYLFGDIFKGLNNKNLVEVKADIRDKEKLIDACRGADCFIHLACISNDPSCDLDLALTKSINYDAFFNVIKAVKMNKIKRLIFASSASIYGTKNEEVTEEAAADAKPLTEYAKSKLFCENVLKDSGLDNYVVLRPGSIYGYAPRMRFDLIVNDFTLKALENKKIIFRGGWQMRPHLNINDIVRLYRMLVELPDELVHKKVFNVSFENYTVENTARMIAKALEEKGVCGPIAIEKLDIFDERSYHLNSNKIKKELGFSNQFTIEDGAFSIARALREGLINDGLNNPLYHNTKMMKLKNLK